MFAELLSIIVTEYSFTLIKEFKYIYTDIYIYIYMYERDGERDKESVSETEAHCITKKARFKLKKYIYKE